MGLKKNIIYHEKSFNKYYLVHKLFFKKKKGILIN